MSRRLKILLAVFVVAVATVTAAGAVSVWLLPDIIRREAITRIPALTGRAVRIEDVDLNLFTGRFAVKGIWVAERDGRTPFVELVARGGPRVASLAPRHGRPAARAAPRRASPRGWRARASRSSTSPTSWTSS